MILMLFGTESFGVSAYRSQKCCVCDIFGFHKLTPSQSGQLHVIPDCPLNGDSSVVSQIKLVVHIVVSVIQINTESSKQPLVGSRMADMREPIAIKSQCQICI